MSGINDTVDTYNTALEAIFDHVGYVQDWKIIPLQDDREVYWKLVDNELKFSPNREALEYWLAEHDDEYGPYGDCLYSNIVYRQRFLPKSVYRGQELTIVCADTQTDDNKILQLLNNLKEIK